MGYVYTMLWFVVAVLLFVKFRKESRIVYVLSAYFIFTGFWWLANQFTEADMMSGRYGWVLRGVSLAMLVVLGIIYALEKQSASRSAEKKPGKEQKEDNDDIAGSINA